MVLQSYLTKKGCLQTALKELYLYLQNLQAQKRSQRSLFGPCPCTQKFLEGMCARRISTNWLHGSARWGTPELPWYCLQHGLCSLRNFYHSIWKLMVPGVTGLRRGHSKCGCLLFCNIFSWQYTCLCCSECNLDRALAGNLKWQFIGDTIPYYIDLDVVVLIEQMLLLYRCHWWGYSDKVIFYITAEYFILQYFTTSLCQHTTGED